MFKTFGQQCQVHHRLQATWLVSMASVRRNLCCHLCNALMSIAFTACSTKVEISLSFGGNSWPINTADMNAGSAGTDGQCMGAIFDLSAGSSAGGGAGNPNWVVGDTFLVCKYDPPLKELTDLAGS